MIVPLLLAATLSVDPRATLIELQRELRFADALAEIERLNASDPGATSRYGLDLLRGDLLARLGRMREGAEAYALAIASSGNLAPWARLRLAGVQETMGHPEVAAGLASTLIALEPPRSLARASVDQLVRAVRRGGDCRLVAPLAGAALPAESARRIRLLAAECALRDGRETDAAQILENLLEERDDDLVAQGAADLWLARWPVPQEPRLLIALSEAAYAQRDFARAVPLLVATLASPGAEVRRRTEELRYALGRAQFWLGQYDAAAAAFASLATETHRPTTRADALYQQGRAIEHLGHAGAAALFARAYEAEPAGEWAGPAILARLRLAAVSGDAVGAEASLSILARRPPWRTALARGALFLASSEIAGGGPTRRAASWLTTGERGSGGALAEEFLYWRGRLHEAEGRPEEAAASYLALLRRRPFHPLAISAQRRLASSRLQGAREALATELLAEGSTRGDHALWLLDGGVGARAEAARERSVAALLRIQGASRWLGNPIEAATAWPIWQQPLDRPEERMLALGLTDGGLAAIAGLPPSARRAMTLAIADLAARRGDAQLALEAAERLFAARPRALPIEWVGPQLQRLLYPLPLAAHLEQEAKRRGVDPWLLAAVLRQESRFAADAVSAVGARGLAQFVLPTAQRLAAGLGLSLPDAEALHDPRLAITLGAAYLADLWHKFGGNELAVVAAYNAGEAQVELWRSSCTSDDPDELLAKIGFLETRTYVVQVLENRAVYASLYGRAGE